MSVQREPEANKASNLAAQAVKQGAANNGSGANTGLPPPNANSGDQPDQAIKIEGDELDGTMDTEVQPAAKVYKNADEALAAAKKGAIDYDDTILEQFTEPGEDCTWCGEFYKSIRDILVSTNTPHDQLSYYGELLAVSGRQENVQALVEGIKSATSTESKDALAEALELTVGKDPVVNYLAEQLGSGNDQLRESSLAAITNQGSRMAAEIIYKHTVERGDPDGYYSLGIGLGEFVPDDESLPYLQELVNKHDQYSHLAVKALLNSGIGGLRLVMDSLASSKDGEFDKQMLRDAVDHVNYEDEVDAYLKKTIAESKNPVVSDFAKKILDAFKVEETSDTNPE